MQKFTAVIFYVSIICIYISFRNYLMLLLKFYTVPVRLHDTKNVVNQNILFNQTRVEFLPRKYDVISQLRHSYTKGSFCVTRLIYSYNLWQFRSSWRMHLHHFFITNRHFRPAWHMPFYPIHTLSPRDFRSRPGSCITPTGTYRYQFRPAWHVPCILYHQRVFGEQIQSSDMCPVFFITNGCSGNNSVAWHVPCILYHQRVFGEQIQSPDMCLVFFITNGCSGNKFCRLTCVLYSL